MLSVSYTKIRFWELSGYPVDQFSIWFSSVFRNKNFVSHSTWIYITIFHQFLSSDSVRKLPFFYQRLSLMSSIFKKWISISKLNKDISVTDILLGLGGTMELSLSMFTVLRRMLNIFPQFTETYFLNYDHILHFPKSVRDYIKGNNYHKNCYKR